MTADQLYRLHEVVQRARENLGTAVNVLEDQGDEHIVANFGFDESAAQLEDVERELFEAYVDAVRREASAA